MMEPNATDAEAMATKPITSAIPLTGEGIQTGKLLVTFTDGTRAIFKPASRDGRGLR